MTYVYLLSFYDEHGSEEVKATLDPSHLHAMIDSYAHPSGANYHAELDRILQQKEFPLRDGANLGHGWGGMQLHVVELE